MKTIVGGSLMLAMALMLTTFVAAQATQEGQTEAPKTQKITVPSCSCCSQGGAAQTSPVILALDIDKDGEISAVELKNAMQSLKTLDRDGNGKLSRDEMHAQSQFSQVNAPTVSKMQQGVDIDLYVQKMMLRDSNDNGVIEKNEMNEAMIRLLPLMDTNRDGVLSEPELRGLQRILKTRRNK